MRAVLIPSPGVVELVERPVPTPAPDGLVVAVEASGVCGTDLRILAGDYEHARLPLVLGHEFAGRVCAVGRDVRGFAEGDLVAADPNNYCGRCEWCARGAVNLCTSGGAIGITRDGALAEMVAVDARYAVRLPDSLDATAGALVEPLSCVLHGLHRADPVPGARMLVLGAGTIGLMALAVGAARGYRCSVVEPHLSRRSVALGLGAEAAVAEAAELVTGDGFDLVLDASGAPVAVRAGLARLRKRGTYLQMGVAPSALEVVISPYAVYLNEWRIIGSNSVEGCYVEAAELMADLADTLRTLVTHQLPLESAAQAMTLMTTPDALKVHLDPRV